MEGNTFGILDFDQSLGAHGVQVSEMPVPKGCREALSLAVSKIATGLFNVRDAVDNTGLIIESCGLLTVVLARTVFYRLGPITRMKGHDVLRLYVIDRQPPIDLTIWG